MHLPSLGLLLPLQLLSSATSSVGVCSMPPFASLPKSTVTRMCPPESGPTSCADGSPFSFLVRRGSHQNERKVLVDFMGGGACWDGESCLSSASTTFQSVPQYASAVTGISTELARQMLALNGMSIAALGNTVPGLKTWTYIFVPYCTQDIHIGTCNATYTHPQTGETRTLRHNGAANVKAVMKYLYSSFPLDSPPETLAFIGCSAGAAAVIVTEAARAAQIYPSNVTRVVAIGDSPSNTLTETFVQKVPRSY